MVIKYKSLIHYLFFWKKGVGSAAVLSWYEEINFYDFSGGTFDPQTGILLYKKTSLRLKIFRTYTKSYILRSFYPACLER